MLIVLNGNKEELDQPMSIADLLKYKKYSFPNLIVRINGDFIKKSDYSEAMVKNEDQVQIIHMISGG